MAKTKETNSASPSPSSVGDVGAAAINAVRSIYGCGNLAAAERLNGLPSDVVRQIGELELAKKRAEILKLIAATAQQAAEEKIAEMKVC
jgi:hypothetical protein